MQKSEEFLLENSGHVRQLELLMQVEQLELHAFIIFMKIRLCKECKICFLVKILLPEQLILLLL